MTNPLTILIIVFLLYLVKEDKLDRYIKFALGGE